MSEQVSIFDLDQHHLDREWLVQPKLYHEYAEALAAARADLDEAKWAYDRMEADQDSEVRRHPERFGLSKVTEDVVRKTIILQVSVQKQAERVLKLKRRVGQLAANVEALDQRKKALENLVTLWSRDYFSEPKMPEIDEKARDDLEDRMKRTIREKCRVPKEE